MNTHTRTFEDAPAVRSTVPLLVGLMGPSGGGKTFSALRLAKGIQTVTGGEIYVIDTEARRAAHYADYFTFRHLEFKAPFGSLDYLAAIRHCVDKGAGVIVVDSLSHEHEGPGGLIDLHDQELDRMAGNDFAKRERVKMLAWQKPKQHRRQFINGLLQMNVNFVFCFRAKETAKPMKVNGKTEVVPLGYMPIAGDEFVFEMTVNCLLLPGAGGVPTWVSDNVGEKSMMKLPQQFRGIFRESQPLSEEIGHDLAQWAKGGTLDGSGEAVLDAARAAAGQGSAALQAHWSKLSAADRKAVSVIKDDLTRLRDAADAAAAGRDETVDDGWLNPPAAAEAPEPVTVGTLDDGTPIQGGSFLDKPEEPPADAPPESAPDAAATVTTGFEAWFADLSSRATRAVDLAELDAIWKADVQPHRDGLIPPDRDALDNLYGRHRKRLVG